MLRVLRGHPNHFKETEMSQLIALVATAVIVNGQRTVIQPGEPLPDLGAHDSRELTASGAALDPERASAAQRTDTLVLAAAQAEFERARKRERQEQESQAIAKANAEAVAAAEAAFAAQRDQAGAAPAAKGEEDQPAPGDKDQVSGKADAKPRK